MQLGSLKVVKTLIKRIKSDKISIKFLVMDQDKNLYLLKKTVDEEDFTFVGFEDKLDIIKL